MKAFLNWKSNMIERKHIWIVAAVSVLLALGTINCTGCKKKAADPPDITHNPGHTSVHTPVEINTPPAESNTPSENTVPKPPEEPKISIKDLIASPHRWSAVYESWYGKTAPDFTLTDIKGKKHNLSDYRGKDVVLVFWATWCGPCIMEIPHLIAFQNIAGKDKVEILGISYIDYRNPADRIKAFAEQNPRINYDIFAANESDMPKPFTPLEYIPSSFFITPEGKIKLATTGTLSLGDLKLIMQAQ